MYEEMYEKIEIFKYIESTLKQGAKRRSIFTSSNADDFSMRKNLHHLSMLYRQWQTAKRHCTIVDLHQILLERFLVTFEKEDENELPVFTQRTRRL